LPQGSQSQPKANTSLDASAWPTEDNRNPVLPVLPFTHRPVGYVKYQGQYYS
jgi:hypothetical protein